MKSNPEDHKQLAIQFIAKYHSINSKPLGTVELKATYACCAQWLQVTEISYYVENCIAKNVVEAIDKQEVPNAIFKEWIHIQGLTRNITEYVQNDNIKIHSSVM